MSTLMCWKSQGHCSVGNLVTRKLEHAVPNQDLGHVTQYGQMDTVHTEKYMIFSPIFCCERNKCKGGEKILVWYFVCR